MTFTYNATWSSARDYVRFQIADTVAPAHFQDEELDALLLQNSSDPRLAAAAALEAWAAEMARQAISYGVTGFNLNRTKVVDAMLATAKRLREEAKAIPFEYESVVDHAVTVYGEDFSNYPYTSEEGEENI